MTAKAKDSDASQEIKDLVFAQSDAIGAHLAALSNSTVMYSVEENRAAVTKPLTFTDPRLQVVQGYGPNTKVVGEGVHAFVTPTKGANCRIIKSEGHDTYIRAVGGEYQRLKYLHLSPEQREEHIQQEKNKKETMQRLERMLGMLGGIHGGVLHGGMPMAGRPGVDLGALLGGGGAPSRGLHSMMAMRAALDSDNDSDNRRSTSPTI